MRWRNLCDKSSKEEGNFKSPALQIDSAGGSLSRRLGPALPDDVTQTMLDQADAEFQSYIYFERTIKYQ